MKAGHHEFCSSNSPQVLRKRRGFLEELRCLSELSSEEVVGVRVTVIPKLRICRQLEKPKVIWGQLDLGSKLCGSCRKQHSKLEDEFCEDKVFLSR